MLDKQENSLNVPFTQEDVNDLIHHLKPGVQVRFSEPVFYNQAQFQMPFEAYKISRGTIMAKYPHLALIKRFDGTLTSVTYVELLLEKRKREREKRALKKGGAG